jgi:hypothetical protein
LSLFWSTVFAILTMSHSGNMWFCMLVEEDVDTILARAEVHMQFSLFGVTLLALRPVSNIAMCHGFASLPV